MESLETSKSHMMHGSPPIHARSPLMAQRPKPAPPTKRSTLSSSLFIGLSRMKQVLGKNFKSSIYALLVLTFCNIFVQIHILLIGVTSREMQQDQDWGNGRGTGYKYDIIAGPIFTAAHILAALPVGYLVDVGCMSHSTLLALAMLIWSGSIAYTGYSTTYWEIMISRIVLAVFMASAGTLCMSIISDFFPTEIRSSACALWNFAIYIGFSVAYGGGNAISAYFDDWRYVWWIFGYAGIFWGALIILIPRFKSKEGEDSYDQNGLLVDNQNTKINPVDPTESEMDMPSQVDTSDEFEDDAEYRQRLHHKHKQKRIKMLGTIRSMSRNYDDYIYTTNTGTYTEHTVTKGNESTTIETDYIEESTGNNIHRQIMIQWQQQQVTMSAVLLYLIKSPSLLLLLFASFYRNCGGYIWGYHADNFFLNEKGEDNYTVAMWLGWVPMIGGSMGCLLGGIISDKLAKNETEILRTRTVIRRIWVLVVANLLSFPFAAGVIVLESPGCYLSLFGMYIFSEMWISVAITLVIDFSPFNMRATMLSIYYFCIGLAGFAPILVSVVEDLMSSYKWSMFILFPCIYGSSSILFFLVVFTYQRDLRKRGAESMMAMKGHNIHY